MEDHNKTGSEVHGLILFKKHAGENAGNRMKETVKKRAVIEEESPEDFVNGENAVPVVNPDEFKGHRGSAFHSIEITAGGAETAVAAERDEFKLATMRTAEHGTTKGGITAMNHFVHVFYDGRTWV